MKSPNRLLLLEDNPDDTTLLTRHLAATWPQCEIMAVTNENDFRAALNAGGFELILSDYVLPRFEGLTALALAREQCPDIPFLFVSGAIGDEVAVESLKAGATDYVLKDRQARLVPAIQRALEQAEATARRKQLETQLRQGEEQYRTLVNSVDGIVWQAELPSLRFTFVSQQAERLLGYPVEQWLREPEFWQQHIHLEDRERAIALCTRLNPKHQFENFEYRMLAADGRVVWLRDIVSVRAEPGQGQQIQGIMVNITPRKQAETARQQIREKLERTNQDLRHKNEEIQNFYHTLSHELKTPLTSALEFISIIMDGLAGPVNETQSEYLGIARESCNQLRVCINDMLDATRLETGKLAIELKPVCLAALAQRVLATMSPKAAKKSITLRQEVQPGLPEVKVDEHRMTQVITNLLNNAINYTSPGGQIVLKAQEAPGHQELVQISVSDTGAGIRKEEQERIFDRLYQVKTGDASTEHGVGLGLYICRELVQLHGGNIWVESEPGKGSTFSFVLPRNRESLQSNLLLIDDDPDVRDWFQRVLATEKFNLRTANDGYEGLQEIRRQMPDIVILDLAMPNLNGPATLKEIRRKWGQVPVIVHTGFTDGDLMKQALAFSPFTLLAKPSSPEQVLETVRKVQRSSDTALWRRNHFGLQKPLLQ
jgi:PAS domain S-box-containing protein